MRTKIFIDFDGTIFDTRQFKKGLFDIFYASGFNEDEVTATYQLECLDYLYSPEDHIARLALIHEFNRTNLRKRLKKLYGQCPQFVYGDAERFLLHINRNQYEVDLFSLGDKEFQMKKIEASGAVGFFDNIFITGKQKWISLEEYITPGEKFIYLDDRGDAVAEAVKKYRHSFCVEINRSKHPTDPMEPDKDFGNITVRDFDQFMQYLEPRIRVP